LTVPVGEFVSNPSFPERSMSPTGGNSFAGMYGAKKTWQFLSRNKVRFGVYERSARDPKLLPGDEYLFTLGGYLQPGGHETFYRSVPDTLLKTHPEYFCLVNGERLPQHHPTVKMGGCTYAQVCTSQDGVISLIADFVDRTLEHGKEKSYPTSFLYGAGDNCTTWCHCARCEKLFDNYAPDRFYYMVNKSAEQVFKKHPDAKLCSWIYSDFRKLPRRIAPDRRLHYTFCDHGRCYTHELSDQSCAINRAMLQLMNDWEKLVGPLQVYEYYCVGQPYAPHEVILAKDLKYYFARKWSGYHDEIPAPDAYYQPAALKGKGGVLKVEQWAARWQQIYLASKLLWDIQTDVTETLDDANRLYYGPAFPAMKPYRELLGKLWTGVSVHFVYGTGGVPCPGAYALQLPDAEKLEKYLAEAEKLAGDKEPYAGRIRLEKKFFKVAWADPAKKLKDSKASGIIRSVSDKITVDGKLKESTWRNASPLGEFRKNKDTLPRYKTFVKAAYDSENLYIAFTCMDEDVAKTTCNAKKHDGDVYGDNDVEMMIDPTGTPGNYF
ncbi:MAG: DUF4838 domain-containing protein, partial [Lentisphaeria bacterium]|nr:DUF4838 domain-containing protein [Lentisphaeria bacterium]